MQKNTLQFMFTPVGLIPECFPEQMTEKDLFWKDLFEADCYGAMYRYGLDNVEAETVSAVFVKNIVRVFWEELTRLPELEMFYPLYLTAEEAFQRCTTKLENVEQLIDGNFPPEMKALFEGEDGLFPSPREISFNCSCPDWALMCKHVAATLYGVGARFDEQPLMFFKLRGIDFNRFIDVTLANKVEMMLKNAEQPQSNRIMREDRLTELFGVL